MRIFIHRSILCLSGKNNIAWGQPSCLVSERGKQIGNPNTVQYGNIHIVYYIVLYVCKYDSMIIYV